MTLQILLAQATLRDRAREADRRALTARLRAAGSRCCAAVVRSGRLARLVAALDRPPVLRAWTGDRTCC